MFTGTCENEMEPILLYLFLREVDVGHLDCSVQGLVVQLETLLNLHQPVHQDGPHRLGYLDLGRYVAGDMK